MRQLVVVVLGPLLRRVELAVELADDLALARGRRRRSLGALGAVGVRRLRFVAASCLQPLLRLGLRPCAFACRPRRGLACLAAELACQPASSAAALAAGSRRPALRRHAAASPAPVSRCSSRSARAACIRLAVPAALAALRVQLARLHGRVEQHQRRVRMFGGSRREQVVRGAGPSSPVRRRSAGPAARARPCSAGRTRHGCR